MTKSVTEDTLLLQIAQQESKITVLKDDVNSLTSDVERLEKGLKDIVEEIENIDKEKKPEDCDPVAFVLSNYTGLRLFIKKRVKEALDGEG